MVQNSTNHVQNIDYKSFLYSLLMFFLLISVISCDDSIKNEKKEPLELNNKPDIVKNRNIRETNQESYFIKKWFETHAVTLTPITTTEDIETTIKLDEASPEDYLSSQIYTFASITNKPPLISLKPTFPTLSSTIRSQSVSPTRITNKTLENPQRNSLRLLRKQQNKFVITTSNILSSIDPTIDVCDDFYLYSCGRAIKQSSGLLKKQNGYKGKLNMNTKYPPNLSFMDKLNRFYNTCVQHEELFDYQKRLEDIKKTVERFIIDEPSIENLTMLTAEMILTNTLPIFELDIDIDKDLNEYVFTLSPPYKSITRDPMESNSAMYNIDINCAKKLLREKRFDPHNLNLNEIYYHFTICKKNFQDYLRSINVTKTAFEHHSLNINPSDLYVEEELVDYLRLDVDTPFIKDRWISKNYMQRTLLDLYMFFPYIDWKLLFNILSGKNLEGFKIFVYAPYLFSAGLRRSSIAYEDMYKNFLTIYLNDLFQMSVIPTAVDTREEFCLNQVDYLFPDVSSYLYMKDLTQDEIMDSQEIANKIFKILQNNFLASVDNTTSIQEDLKEKIKERISKLSLQFINKSNACISELLFKWKYQSIDLKKSNYISQVVEMRKHKNSVKYSLIGEIFKDDDIFCYFMKPQDLKPKSSYTSSKIAIPYEFLLPWSMDYPGYILMAKIGTQIAIEMGKLFNKVGLSYITNDTNILADLEDGIRDHFLFVNNRNVLITPSDAKNIQAIGDNAGFKLAFKSFNQLQTNNTRLPWISKSEILTENGMEFSEERMFFIAAAQEFCEDGSYLDYMLKICEGETFPNYWRVNNMIINTEEFRNVFNCKIGSYMAPGDASYLAFPQVKNEEDDD